MESLLFDDVADVLLGLVPAELGLLCQRPRRYGIKVWFDSDAPGAEHYEAQVIAPRHVRGAKTLALEIGFHAEHRTRADNDATLARLCAQERRWRKHIGTEAQAGPFLGRADTWRRISETWPDPDLSDADLAFELGARLTDYIRALEPLRRVKRPA